MDLRLERRKRDMKKYKTTIIITTLITLLPIGACEKKSVNKILL